MNNTQIITLIFLDIENYLKEARGIFRTNNVLCTLARTVCELEGEEEYKLFSKTFKEKREFIIGCSGWTGPLIHNPIWGGLQFVYIKLEHLKIIKFKRISIKPCILEKNYLFSFYKNEFSQLLARSNFRKLILLKNNTNGSKAEIKNLLQNKTRETPDYRWKPSDLWSPWLFIE